MDGETPMIHTRTNWTYSNISYKNPCQCLCACHKGLFIHLLMEIFNSRAYLKFGHGLGLTLLQKQV